MAFLGNLLFGSGGNGANFQAQSANVQNPFQNQQVNQAAGGLSAAQQQSLAQMLSQQANVQGNQNTAQGALGQNQQLVNALQAQNGLGNQSSVYGQQQALANQLGQMAQGGGPNPALAQLNQTTGQNIANQGALMASQRGAGANAGLLAREAAQQGAATQQQAVGQAATQRANQQLGAISALQQQQQNLGNLATTQAGQQIGATNANTQLAQGQQGLGLQGQSLSQQYGLGQQQIALANQGQQLGAVQALNQANIANAGQANQANAGVAHQNAQTQGGLLSGLLGGIGNAILPGVGGLVGGAVGSLFGGGDGPPGSNVSDYTSLAQGGQVSANLKENYSGQGPRSRLGQYLAKGGKAHMAKIMVSPGEKILPPGKAKGGKVVPGKPKVDGAVDSYDNDTVPMKVPVGSRVIPRSVTKSANPKEAQEKFVATLKARKK